RRLERWTPQIERARIILVHLRAERRDLAAAMAEREEAGGAAALGFIGVHGETVEAAAARMGHVPRAAADHAVVPGVDEIEHQRRMHADRRMQARGWLPRPITYAGHELAGSIGG